MNLDSWKDGCDDIDIKLRLSQEKNDVRLFEVYDEYCTKYELCANVYYAVWDGDTCVYNGANKDLAYKKWNEKVEERALAEEK